MRSPSEKTEEMRRRFTETYIDAKDVKAVFGITTQQLSRLKRQGKLRAAGLPFGNYFFREEVERFFHERNYVSFDSFMKSIDSKGGHYACAR